MTVHILWMRDGATAFAVGLLGCLCFLGSLQGKFVFDDVAAIVNNKDVRRETPLEVVFKNDFWGTPLLLNSSHKSFRPLTVLSFRFNVWLKNGELDPYGFHLFNIVLHGISSALAFILFIFMFQRKRVYDLKPLIAAILFAVHPVHTEAVAGIVGRADLLCAIFTFLTTIFYSWSISFNSITYLKEVSFSTILAAVATFSKEQGITALALCSLYDLIIINSIHLSDLSSLFQICKEMKITKNGILISNMKSKLLKKETHSMIIRQILLLISGSLIVYLRCWLMNFEVPKFQKIDNPASFAEGIFTRIINYNYIYVINIWITICPSWLCFDWSMGCVPLILNWMDIRIITVFTFWTFMFALLKQSIKLGKSILSQQIMMSLGFIVVSFLPASNLLFRVGFVIAERNLYLPSFGYCMLVSIGIERLYIGLRRKHALYFLMAILFVTNTSRCYQRSLDWNSEKLLFLSGLSVCPLNAKVHYNVAKSSFNVTTSIKHYREAIRLNPEYEQALNNLANVLRDNGDINESENLLRKAIQIRGDFATAWMNLGIVLSHMQRYDEALDCYKTALRHRKKYPDCYYNLGNLYLSQKKHAEAYLAWREATNQKPKHSIAWNNMIVLMDSLEELDKAEELAFEALEILPDDANLHFNLANTLGKKSQYELAEDHFKIAIKLKPNQALFHTNLGVLYHRWKKFKEAEEQYLIALSISPDQKNVEQDLKNVQKQLLKTGY